MKRISSKLILAIVISLVIPLLGYMYFVLRQMEDHLLVEVVRYFLREKADDVAREIDHAVRQRNRDALDFAGEEVVLRALRERLDPDRETFAETTYALERRLATWRTLGTYDERADEGSVSALRNHYAAVVVVDRAGDVVATEPSSAARRWSLRNAFEERIPFVPNVAFEPWFRRAMAARREELDEVSGGDRMLAKVAREDRHRSPLLAEVHECLRRMPLGAVYAVAVPVVEDGLFRGALVDLVEVQGSPIREGPDERSGPGGASPVERWFRGTAFESATFRVGIIRGVLGNLAALFERFASGTVEGEPLTSLRDVRRQAAAVFRVLGRRLGNSAQRRAPGSLSSLARALEHLANSAPVRDALRTDSDDIDRWRLVSGWRFPLPSDVLETGPHTLCRLLVDAAGRAYPRQARPDRVFALNAPEGVALSIDDVPWFQSLTHPGDHLALERRALGAAWVTRDREVLARISVSMTLEPEVSKNPNDYVVAFAAPVFDRGEEPEGVVLFLWRWAYVQMEILDRVEEDFDRDFSYESGYAFLFASDGDTIIGHQGGQSEGESPSRIHRPNYGTRLTTDHRLIGLHDEVVARASGTFAYEYPEGIPKNAGYRRCLDEASGGFSWIVGVGIDDADTRGSLAGLRQSLLLVALLVAIASLLWVFWVSRSITRPIHRLISLTNEVARGDLSARVEIVTEDEIGQLARAFNYMTQALHRVREQLIRAEKDAAWREMARQIAHEIKNPLTPMQLSTTLLLRAHREKPEEFPAILERSVDTISRQIESLRRIASDFSSFAGAPRRPPEPVELDVLVEQCLELYRGMAENSRVELVRTGETATVIVDREELRRVFINLIDNAFEAIVEARLPEGRIEVELRRVGHQAVVRFIDDGPGIPEEIRQRLFEPYFSTKTTGTGLGLAICRRIVSDRGGSITLEDERGRGTVVRVVLPLPESSAPEPAKFVD
ncbi:MAG: HAMP domain-containing protein [Planctomycetes bacterium]|nr:HAMP domain-containing protein [Planctomycetota bacterium]